MKQIKLEVGKTYRNRKGEEIKIVWNDNTKDYPFQGSNGKWYTESGQWCNMESPHDLIEEDFGDIDDEDLDADYGYSKPKPLNVVSERWIVIKACSDPMMWYARQIARHYKVERECLDYYWVKENGTGPINIVHKQDASLYLQKKLI